MVLQVVHPEHITVEICRAEELDRRRGLTSELDEMWVVRREEITTALAVARY